MAEPRVTIEPPRRRPRKGGLFDVADLRSESRLGASVGAQYVPEPCDLTYNDVGFCYSTVPGDATKTFDGIDNSISTIPNFGIGYGVECWVGPDSQADFLRRARLGLESTEERAVEAALYTWLNGAVAIPLGSLALAIAAAEHEADENYIGMPILHLNRGQAVIAASEQLIFPDPLGSGQLVTANGTPVVSSSAYVEGTVYISGDVTVLQSPVIETASVQLELNTQHALAERIYGVVVDCDYRAKYTITP